MRPMPKKYELRKPEPPKPQRPSLMERLARWWEGRYIPPPKNDNSGIIFITLGRYERPALRRAFDFAVNWLRKNGNEIAVKSVVALIAAGLGGIGWAIWRLVAG
jgi:hypothetical protein